MVWLPTSGALALTTSAHRDVTNKGQLTGFEAVKQDRKFIVALGRGQRWALETFYHQLRNAKNDAAFWTYLTGLIPQAVARRQRPQIDRLKEHLDSPDFRQFIKTVPLHLLASFMMLAMLVSACSKPERTTPTPATSDLTPADTGKQPGADTTTKTAAAKPTATAADTATADDKPLDVQTMNAEQLKKELEKYIGNAHLPASEKRRLMRRLAAATEPVVIKSRTQLAKLFKENDPQRIAVLLEQMVMFQRYQPRPPKPHPKPRYKGVDFA